LFKVIGDEASGAAKFTELRWVHNYQFQFYNGELQKPVSVDVGNEAFWQSATYLDDIQSDYLATLWFISEGTERGADNVLLNMDCSISSASPVKLTAMELNADKYSFSPNGPACNSHNWVASSTSAQHTVPSNPAFVSSGGYLPGAGWGYGPGASYTFGGQRCNVAVISGTDGSVSWGGYSPSGTHALPDSSICAWVPIAAGPAAGFASVANGYDVIWTISAGATPVIKYHMLGTQGQLTSLNLTPYTQAVVLPSPPNATAGSPGWVTVTNFPTTPFFVDAFNSTLVYIVDTNQTLWKLNAVSSWTRIKIPAVKGGTGLIGTGPVPPTPFAPNVAALNVGPDAVYVEDNAAQHGASWNNHLRLPY